MAASVAALLAGALYAHLVGYLGPESFALPRSIEVPVIAIVGGQQQMVILSCTTIRSPRFLLLDEPSRGLAPIIVRQIYGCITEYARHSGITVVVAEQWRRWRWRATAVRCSKAATSYL